jgi:hypothetical protein
MSIPTSIKNTLNNSGFDREMIYKFIYDYNCVLSGDAVIKSLSESLNINHRLYKVKDLHLWIETDNDEYYDQNIENIENIAYSYGYIYQSEINSDDMNNYNYIDIIPYILPRYLTNVKCICFSKVENLWNIPFTNRIGDYRFFLFIVNSSSSLTGPNYENILNILNNTFISLYNSYYHKYDISSNIFFEIQNNKLNTVITFCPMDMLDNLNNLHIKEYLSILIRLSRTFQNFNFKLPVHNNLEYLKIYLSIQYFIQLNPGDSINKLICQWNYIMNQLNSNITLKYINILDDYKFTDIYNEYNCNYLNYESFIEFYNSISLYDCMNYMNLITPIQYSDSFLTGYNRIDFYSIVHNTSQELEPTYEPQIISNEYLDYSDYEDEYEDYNEEDFIEDLEEDEIEDVNLNTLLPDIYDLNYSELYTKYKNYIQNDLGLINFNIELSNKIKKYKDKLLESPICNQGIDVLLYTDFSGKEINKVKDYIISSNSDLEQDEIDNILKNYKIIGLFSPENNTMLCFELEQELNSMNNKKILGIISKTREEAEILKLTNSSQSFVSLSIFNKMFIPKDIFRYLPFKSNESIHSVYLLIDTGILWFDTNPAGISSYHNDEQGDKLYIIIPLDFFDFL